MRKHHPNNERVKRQYFTFLKEAKRQDESSVDAVAKAISRFEAYTKWRDFKAFHFEQAVGFKAHLAEQTNQHAGKLLSKASLNSTLRSLKTFMQWLALQPGFKSRISYTDAEYFNLSSKDARGLQLGMIVLYQRQVRRGISLMSCESVIEPLADSLDCFEATFRSKGLDGVDGFDCSDFVNGNTS
tara:strand:- start:1137 stop:1691 length:555 start_codon:yes stop_codon:yes gene_type:complete